MPGPTRSVWIVPRSIAELEDGDPDGVAGRLLVLMRRVLWPDPRYESRTEYTAGPPGESFTLAMLLPGRPCVLPAPNASWSTTPTASSSSPDRRCATFRSSSPTSTTATNWWRRSIVPSGPSCAGGPGPSRSVRDCLSHPDLEAGRTSPSAWVR